MVDTPSDGPALHPLLEVLDRTLDHRLTKALLAGLVILSLIPIDDAVERNLRPVYLIVFGAELFARALLYRTQRRGESVVQVVFAFVDVLAFVSFLPVEAVIGEDKAFVLRILRLTRLLMLLRFAKELALDIYTIMTRREQLQQFALVTAAVGVLSFVSAVIIATLNIPHDNTVADPNFIDDLWWAFRQMESADNLVQSVRVPPIVFVISLVLTVTGVFVISFIIGIGSNVVDQVVASERRRALTYRGHTLVTGPVHSSEVLIGEFVRIYAKNRQIPAPEKLVTWLRHMNPVQTAKPFPRVALLGRRDDPPPYLWEPLMRWVVYRQGDAAEPSSLDLVNARHAKRAILLARGDAGHEVDAVSIATLAAFRAKNKDAHAFVEVTESATVPIVHQVGGPGTHALDMPHLLGMFLCQHLITPGVEKLYRDLLTSEGSEIYTHVFVEEAEKRALREVAGAGHVRFEDLARAALARHDVYLIGVLLGDDEVSRKRYDNVPFDTVVPWLNPYVMPADDPRVAAFGAQPGLIPLAKFRGLIGICDSYMPLAAAARDFTLGTSVPSSKERKLADHELEALAASSSVPPAGPKHVALIGISDALPSLVRELARYVPGVDAVLFASSRDDRRVPLARRLAALGVDFGAYDELPGRQGRRFELERGGSITIYTHDAPDLAHFAASVLGTREHPISAAVFLSEPEGEERDARIALRILRFVRLLEEGKVPHGGELHVLAEFISVEKGAHIQQHVDVRKCGFHHENDLRLTLVSTDTVKNFFMVHSAFVPGVVGIFEDLLEERGQEICRLRFDPPASLETTTMRALQQALLPLGCVAFAVELDDRDVILAPPADQPLATKSMRGIYVIADAAYLGAPGNVAPAAASKPR